MTTYTTAIDTSTALEVLTCRGHYYYRDEDSISTMNTTGDGSSSRYSYSSSNNRSHRITDSQVVDATDNDSVDRDTTLGSFQAVTS